MKRNVMPLTHAAATHPGAPCVPGRPHHASCKAPCHAPHVCAAMLGICRAQCIDACWASCNVTHPGAPCVPGRSPAPGRPAAPPCWARSPGCRTRSRSARGPGAVHAIRMEVPCSNRDEEREREDVGENENEMCSRGVRRCSDTGADWCEVSAGAGQRLRKPGRQERSGCWSHLHVVGVDSKPCAQRLAVARKSVIG